LSSTGFCKIRDVVPEDIDSLIYLCVPLERNDKLFIEGINVKRAWANNSLDMFGRALPNALIEDAKGSREALKED